ncbi:MAG: flagellar FlbD family protein [Planctomycetota bacterium]|jgi:flagellar protein FlbD|nr:flagellar FlbD family protein [Planctomycetota bacterium]
MISLTRLNGSRFVVNAEHIKFIEEVPDTIVTLRDGEKLLVRESADRVVELSLEYSRLTRFLPEAGGGTSATWRGQAAEALPGRLPSPDLEEAGRI